jgi:hypothetical protein
MKLFKSALRWAMVFGLLAAAFWGTWSLFAPIPTVSEINIVTERWTICIPVWPATRLWDIPGLALLAAGFALFLWLGDLSDRRDFKWAGDVAIFAVLMVVVFGLILGSFCGFAYGLIIGLLIGIAIWTAAAFGVILWRMLTSKSWPRFWHWLKADQVPTTT